VAGEVSRSSEMGRRAQVLAADRIGDRMRARAAERPAGCGCVVAGSNLGLGLGRPTVALYGARVGSMGWLAG
jgi:hypothetical protein